SNPLTWKSYLLGKVTLGIIEALVLGIARHGVTTLLGSLILGFAHVLGSILACFRHLRSLGITLLVGICTCFAYFGRFQRLDVLGFGISLADILGIAIEVVTFFLCYVVSHISFGFLYIVAMLFAAILAKFQFSLGYLFTTFCFFFTH